MFLDKNGLYHIVPLNSIPRIGKELQITEALYRLWIVIDNVSVPDSDIQAGDLECSLCFYPLEYVPDIPREYLHGYAIWFNRQFVQLNPMLKRFAELLQQWQDPTVTIRRQEAWFRPCLATCQSQEFIEHQGLVASDTYRYLHCTLIINYLCDLFTGSIPWLAPEERLSELTSRFLELVENHYVAAQSPAFYARELFVSESTLFKRCRRELGKSPGEVVNFRLIKEAKQLLSHTQLSGKEIADQLNFNSYAYFCERFKNATSVTPRIFRQLNRPEH